VGLLRSLDEIKCVSMLCPGVWETTEMCRMGCLCIGSDPACHDRECAGEGWARVEGTAAQTESAAYALVWSDSYDPAQPDRSSKRFTEVRDQTKMSSNISTGRVKAS